MTGVIEEREYHLEQAVAGTYNHNVLGAIDFDFDKGVVRPRSEQEEIVLEEQLVPAGIATATGPARQVSVGNFVRGDVAAEPEASDGAPPASANYADFPEDGSIDDVLGWVRAGDEDLEDADRASHALLLESYRDHPRKGVLAVLEPLVTPEA